MQEGMRAFKMAAWLGWQIESNWTDPFLFAIYSIVRPIAGAAILVIMFGIITAGNFGLPIFAYIFLGNAFYIYVGAVMSGMAWSIIDDRERYKMLKYIYLAPIHVPTYLMGRAVARFLTSTASVVITILAGVLFLNLKLDLASVHWPLFFVALVVGVIMLALMGLLLAGVVLLTAHHVFLLGEAVAGALYLFCGAIFPLEALPTWLRPFGYAIPITYWLELLRRALVGKVAEAFPTLSGFTDLQLLGILLAMTALFGLLAGFVFAWCDRLARERGLIDRVSNY